MIRRYRAGFPSICWERWSPPRFRLPKIDHCSGTVSEVFGRPAYRMAHSAILGDSNMSDTLNRLLQRRRCGGLNRPERVHSVYNTRRAYEAPRSGCLKWKSKWKKKLIDLSSSSFFIIVFRHSLSSGFENYRSARNRQLGLNIFWTVRSTESHCSAFCIRTAGDVVVRGVAGGCSLES